MLTKLQKVAHIAAASWRATAQGLRAAPPTYVDIGARGGLPRPWGLAHRLGLIRPVLFEPDAEAAAEIKSLNPGVAVAPYALGSADLKAETLRVTVSPAQTSILVPDKSNPFLNASWDVAREIELTVRRFDAVWDGKWGTPDFVKIDVQGYEVEVIKGMGDHLRSTLCVELESSFIPFYHGQPVFQDVHDFMRRNGFDLVKLRPIGLYRGSVVVEFNAFFVKAERHDDPRVRFWKAVNDVGKEKRIWAHGY
jgi:FkbM family methyltransferase